MTLHWGELRECTSHQSEHGPFQVCQGCRVQHQQQTLDSDNHKAAAMRGARMHFCIACATEALEGHGVNHRGCTCVGEWTCYDCQEAELAELSRARRRGYAEGRCGKCLRPADLVKTADICLKCDNLSTRMRSACVAIVRGSKVWFSFQALNRPNVCAFGWIDKTDHNSQTERVVHPRLPQQILTANTWTFLSKMSLIAYG